MEFLDPCLPSASSRPFLPSFPLLPSSSNAALPSLSPCTCASKYSSYCSTSLTYSASWMPFLTHLQPSYLKLPSRSTTIYNSLSTDPSPPVNKLELYTLTQHLKSLSLHLKLSVENPNTATVGKGLVSIANALITSEFKIESDQFYSLFSSSSYSTLICLYYMTPNQRNKGEVPAVDLSFLTGILSRTCTARASRRYVWSPENLLFLLCRPGCKIAITARNRVITHNSRVGFRI